jgi:hypothetical protein
LNGASIRPDAVPASESDLIDALPDRPFKVTITKTTQQEEAAIGADLGIRIESPLGVKRALMQAKVYDPQDDRLRCDSPAEWDRVWNQLFLMHNRSPLAFFLIYVPAAKLNWAPQGIPTWEQGYRPEKQTDTSSKFGATLIPVDSLLNSKNNYNWQYPKPVSHIGDGRFRPEGISLAKLLIEMVLCRQGDWIPSRQFRPEGIGIQDDDSYPVRYVPYREIAISFNDLPDDEWNDFVASLNTAIEEMNIT